MLKCFLFFLIPFPIFAISIAFIGDSVSNGYGVEQQECYVNILQNRFINEQKDIQCINRSFNGAKTNTAAQIGVSLITQDRPDYIILLLGINDAVSNTPQDILQANFASMISACRHNCKRIILGGIDPSLYNPSYGTILVTTYLNLINLYAVYPLFILNSIVTAHTIDSIHPDETGHQIMADIIYNALSDLGVFQ